MINLVGTELYKLFHNKWLYYIFSIIFMYYGYCIFDIFTTYIALVNYPELFFPPLRGILFPIFSLVLVCLAYTDEVEYGTIKTALCQGYTRIQVFNAKVVAYFVFLAVVVYSSIVISYLLALIPIISGVRIDVWQHGFFDGAVFLRALHSHSLVFIGLLPFAFLAMFLGLLLRNRLKTIVTALLIFVIDLAYMQNNLSIYAKKNNKLYSLSYYLTEGFIRAYSNQRPEYFKNRHLIFWDDTRVFLIGLAVCTCYCVIFHVLSVLWFRKMEIK